MSHPLDQFILEFWSIEFWILLGSGTYESIGPRIWVLIPSEAFMVLTRFGLNQASPNQASTDRLRPWLWSMCPSAVWIRHWGGWSGQKSRPRWTVQLRDWTKISVQLHVLYYLFQVLSFSTRDPRTRSSGPELIGPKLVVHTDQRQYPKNFGRGLDQILGPNRIEWSVDQAVRMSLIPTISKF